MWKVATTAAFDQWFAGLDEDAQAEVIAKVNLLRLLGPQLGRPHADTLKGSKYANLKELRATVKKAVLRIAFAFDPSVRQSSWSAATSQACRKNDSINN